MKNILKKLFLIIGFVVLAIGVPVLINESYKTGSGYQTLWDAKDVLTYYGALLAACGTCLGVFLTVQHSRKQYRDDKEKDVMPYFAIDILARKCVDPIVKGLYYDVIQSGESNISESLKYREYKRTKNYFVFSKAGVSFTSALTKEQQEQIETNFEIEEHDEFGQIARPSPMYVPMIFVNVGNGCAVNAKVKITEVGGIRSACSLPTPVLAGAEIYTGLYVENDVKLAGNFNIEIVYTDIYDNDYSDKIGFAIEDSKTHIYLSFNQKVEHIKRVK